MKEFKKVLSTLGVKAIVNLNKSELNTLGRNLSRLRTDEINYYIKSNMNNLIYLLKSMECEDENTLKKHISLLDELEEFRGENEHVYNLMRRMATDKKVWYSRIINYYTSYSTKTKIEKLLDGLEYNEDLFLDVFFLQNLNEKGIENYRKLYGNLPKTSLGFGFLNITDDKNFLNKLPEVNFLNQEIRTHCTLEELRSFRDESLKDDYFFSPLLGHYNYKDYEDDLIEFEKNNKEFLEEISDNRDGGRNIKNYLKALKLLRENESLRKKLLNKKISASNSLIIKFISDSFILGRTEEEILKILEKVIEKSFAIESVYGTLEFNYFTIAYLGDVVLRLNSSANPTKLKNLCFLASLVGLEDERFKEALKGKVSAFGVEKIYRDISPEKQEEIFKKNFGMTSEEFFLKSLTGVEPREEDLEKIEYLKSKGYKLMDIYGSLKSIDNIIYLINNGYDVAWSFMDYVRPFYKKEDLNTIIKHNIDLAKLNWAYIYNYKEIIKKKVSKAIKRRQENEN